ncbi:MAG TPA: flagellar basal-body rod protein FlgF [Stellaceae bacterium]|nr:flagellar basal-body rod protein FlgF [Stellaceae bacterium]
MNVASYVSISRQTALSRQIDIVANNMANLSTTGFKGESVVFRSMLKNTPDGGAVNFVIDGGVWRDNKQGSITPTSNPLDVAIDGDGFLTVDTNAGTRYTRNGHLQLAPDRKIVTANGDQVVDAKGNPITIPENASAIEISATGRVSTPEGGDAGILGLASFGNSASLVPSENGLFVATEPAAAEASTAKLVQGAVEESNVQPIVEMTKLMQLQRSYEIAKQMTDGEGDRLKSVIDRLGKIT